MTRLIPHFCNKTPLKPISLHLALVPQPTMPNNPPQGDQCAVGKDGKLLPAEKIKFRHDSDSKEDLPPETEEEIMKCTLGDSVSLWILF